MKFAYTAAILALGLAGLATSPAAALPHSVQTNGPAAVSIVPGQALKRRRVGLFNAVKNIVSRKKSTSTSKKQTDEPSNGSKGQGDDNNRKGSGGGMKTQIALSTLPMAGMMMMPTGGGGSAPPEGSSA